MADEIRPADDGPDTEGKATANREGNVGSCNNVSADVTGTQQLTATSNQSQDVAKSDSSSDPHQFKKTKVGKLKELTQIFKIYMPLSIFWAMFFLRSSTFITQAAQMDCYIGSLHVHLVSE